MFLPEMPGTPLHSDHSGEYRSIGRSIVLHFVTGDGRGGCNTPDHPVTIENGDLYGLFSHLLLFSRVY